MTTTLSYNINKKTGCCLVYNGNEIKDISIFSNPEDYSKEETARRATEIISRFKNKFESSSYIYRYPPMLKGRKQEEMIHNLCDVQKNDEFCKSPFSINATISTMYNKRNVRPPSFRNITNKWYLYTDASVVDSRDPSISSCILNSDKEILYLLSASINETRNVAEAEACAGLIGLNIVKQSSCVQELDWYCDNNIVLRYIDDQNEEKLELAESAKKLEELFNSEDGFTKNSIRGSENTLADSMAKDIRHKEVKDHFSFTSPAVKETISKTDVNENLSTVRATIQKSEFRS